MWKFQLSVFSTFNFTIFFPEIDAAIILIIKVRWHVTVKIKWIVENILAHNTNFVIWEFWREKKILFKKTKKFVIKNVSWFISFLFSLEITPATLSEWQNLTTSFFWHKKKPKSLTYINLPSTAFLRLFSPIFHSILSILSTFEASKFCFNFKMNWLFSFTMLMTENFLHFYSTAVLIRKKITEKSNN